MLDIKKCVDCGKKKSRDFFKPSRFTDDGLYQRCTDCSPKLLRRVRDRDLQISRDYDWYSQRISGNFEYGKQR